MASTSAPRTNTGYERIASTASTLYSDNQTLIAEIRKGMNMMKEIAVEFETDNDSAKVKELEDGVLELLKASDECTHLSNAMQSIKDEYQPGPQLTNFNKLFDEKIERLKKDSPPIEQNNLLLRQFREAIWKVHHAGQAMPGEEQEDIVMTSTESNILNSTCPLTGKAITELEEPVRSMDCKHIYEKQVIMQHIKSKTSQCRCPVAGCPRILRIASVVCDPLLMVEIDELRSMNNQRGRGVNIEDFTDLVDEED